MFGRITSFARFISFGTFASVLVACGGGNNGGPFNGNGPNGTCDPGTAVQLASPFPNATGVSSNTNPIIIVTNGNTNNLSSNPQNWDVVLQDNLGNQIVGGNLSPVSDPSGPHPFGMDFYYASNLQQNLVPNATYRVFVNQLTNCNPLQVGVFST